MKKRSDVKKGRFSMGDEVLNLNLEKGADAIVFIRGEGKKLTGGKTAFTLLVGGAPAYLRLQIGIVDARNGEVLLYTDPIFPGDPTTAVDRLRKALEKGFKKLPEVKTLIASAGILDSEQNLLTQRRRALPRCLRLSLALSLRTS